MIRKTHPVQNSTTGSPAARLARAITGRPQRFQSLDVAALRRYPEGLAVNEPAGLRPYPVVDVMDDDMDAAVERLRGELAAEAGETVVPAPKRGRTMVRRIIIPPVVALGLAGGGLASAPHADAAVLPGPVRVVISGPTTTIRVPVTSTGPVAALVSIPLARGGFVDRYVTSPRSTVVVTVTVPSARLVVGAGQVIEALDLREWEGTPTRYPFQVVRQSRVSAPMVTPTPGGVVVYGMASHYDPARGGYSPDLQSPVGVQVWSDGRWVTVASPTTDGTGTVAAYVTLPAGAVRIRLARPAGATVTGGTGVEVTVRVPSPTVPACVRSARGDLICAL